MKNSFVLYTDYMKQMELLDMEQRGILFTAIMEYVSDGDLPDQMDRTTEMAFSFIKAQIDRDSDKYNEICEKRRAAGRKGGLAKQANAKSAKSESSKIKQNKQGLANQADNDNEYEDDNEDDNENDINNPLNNTYIHNARDSIEVTMYSTKKEGGS